MSESLSQYLVNLVFLCGSYDTDTNTHTHIYIYIHTHIYIYIHTHIYIYIYIYTHTYIFLFFLFQIIVCCCDVMYPSKYQHVQVPNESNENQVQDVFTLLL